MRGAVARHSGEAMFDTAYAQAAGAAGGAQGFMQGPFGSLLFFLPLIVLFYFLIFRPQQQRAKQHATMIGGLKRGDTIVLSSGIVGKVVRVEDKEIGLEVASGVTVKVVKSMIADVRARGEPAAANDSKA
jgi:preprotein translocase subunit YajC